MTRIAILTLVLLAGCKTNDPLYCDEDTPCTDPDRPYCDLEGQYPASEGVGRTCIASPFDAGPEQPDGGGSVGTDADVPRRILQLATGDKHACAVFNDGGMRCWGTGWLGYGGQETIGDEQLPYTAGDVPVGGHVVEAALGDNFSCVRFDEGTVRCWGVGNVAPAPEDDDPPGVEEDINLGAPAKQIAAGKYHACALLEGDVVRCWGDGIAGQLGYGNNDNVTDPSAEDPVVLGGTPLAVTAGASRTCAVLAGGRVQCWGAPTNGGLGYGNAEFIGETESPADAGDVNVGGTVIAIRAGERSTCALLEGGDVRCWGALDAIGQPDIDEAYGDSAGETPAAAGNVTIGGEAVEISIGGSFSCARLTTGSLRCWGSIYSHGDGDHIGDDETPSSAGNVSIGGNAVLLADGSEPSFMCTLLENQDVRCWGANNNAQLGLGHTEHVGDNELPDSQDPVQVLDPE